MTESAQGKRPVELTCSKCGQEIEVAIEHNGMPTGYRHISFGAEAKAKKAGCVGRAQPTALEVTASEEE